MSDLDSFLNNTEIHVPALIKILSRRNRTNFRTGRKDTIGSVEIQFGESDTAKPQQDICI